MTTNDAANIVTNNPILRILTMTEIVLAIRSLPPLNRLQLEQLLQAHLARLSKLELNDHETANSHFACAIPHIAALNEIYNNVK